MNSGVKEIMLPQMSSKTFKAEEGEGGAHCNRSSKVRATLKDLLLDVVGNPCGTGSGAARDSQVPCARFHPGLTGSVS